MEMRCKIVHYVGLQDGSPTLNLFDFSLNEKLLVDEKNEKNGNFLNVRINSFSQLCQKIEST